MGDRNAEQMHGGRLEFEQQSQKLRLADQIDWKLFVEPAQRAEAETQADKPDQAGRSNRWYVILLSSVFFSEHDCDDPFRNGRVCWVR